MKQRHWLPLTSFLLLLPNTTWSQAEKIFRHQGWVGAIVFSRDSQTLYSGGADQKIMAWDVSDRKSKSRQFEVGHSDMVCALALTRDGKTLASASFDGTAKLWDPATGKLRHTLKAHRGAVMSLAFSPDGTHLVTGGMDGGVLIWETASGKKVGPVTQHRSWVNAVAFAADGTLATGSSDNTFKLLGEKAKKKWLVKDTSEFGVGEVRSLAFAPDSKKLAIGLRYGTLHLRDWSGGKSRELNLPGHEADVWAVAFSPDGKTLASGNGDWDRPGPVILWDVATGKKKGTFTHTNEVLSLAFSPDGERLAAGGWDGAIHVWKLKK